MYIFLKEYDIFSETKIKQNPKNSHHRDAKLPVRVLNNTQDAHSSNVIISKKHKS